MMKSIKKQLVTLLLCLMFSLVLTSCVKEDEGKRAEKDAKLIDADIRSGEFVINGEVYSFPMDMAYLKDKGWHVSNNYSNKNKFTLGPAEYTDSVTLFNDQKQYIKVVLINLNQSEAKLDECFVKSLELSFTDGYSLVLPGGMFSECTQNVVKSVYGETDAQEEEDYDMVKWGYNYTGKDNWECQTVLEIYDESVTQKPFLHVTYYLLDSATNSDNLLLQGGASERCSHYINSALNTCYYGDFNEYTSIYDSEENAKALYDSYVDYYAQDIMYYCGITSDLLDYSTYSKFDELAADILKKTKWEITKVTIDEDSLIGTMEIKLYPTDYLDIIYDEVGVAETEFLEKYENTDLSSLTDEQNKDAEIDYANIVLDHISGYETKTTTKEPVTKEYSVDFNNNWLTEDDWSDLDVILMDHEF